MSENELEVQPIKSKKRLIFLLLGPLIIFILSFSYLHFSTPVNDMQKLIKGYVKVHVKKKRTDRFEIVSKMPSGWVHIKDMPKSVVEPIVLSEDWGFFQHDGVDYSQIKKAIEDRIVDGKKLRGASTISQQLVKNLFLSNERSLVRKFREWYYVRTLETKLSKKKILEIYLNVLHLGPGVYGVANASQYYFNKPLGELNHKEGAFLAMLLPSPVKYGESFRKKRLSEFAKSSIEKIIDKLVLAKKITPEEAEDLKKRAFNWESLTEEVGIKEKVLDNDTGSENNINKDKSDSEKTSDPNAMKLKNSKKPRFIDGSKIEASMKEDPDSLVDEDLTYDDDALIEDESGFDSEFSVDEN